MSDVLARLQEHGKRIDPHCVGLPGKAIDDAISEINEQADTIAQLQEKLDKAAVDFLAAEASHDHEVSELQAAHDAMEKRMIWTIENNVRKAMQIEVLQKKLRSWITSLNAQRYELHVAATEDMQNVLDDMQARHGDDG